MYCLHKSSLGNVLSSNTVFCQQAPSILYHVLSGLWLSCGLCHSSLSTLLSISCHALANFILKSPEFKTEQEMASFIQEDDQLINLDWVKVSIVQYLATLR